MATALVATAGLVASGTAAWSALDEPADLPSTVQPAPTEQLEDPRPAAESPGATPGATPDPASGTTPSSARVARADAALSGLEPSRTSSPAALTIPSAGLDLPVRDVGVAADGQMQLPADPRVIGWYRYGPAPRAGSGSVVLAGHLDSRRFGIGPLVRLRDVDPGARVQVRMSDGRTAAYRVVAVERFDRQRLPQQLFARTGPELLRVITCGGAYDPDSGYEENLVVTAALLTR